jgi:hypothetical protein
VKNIGNNATENEAMDEAENTVPNSRRRIEMSAKYNTVRNCQFKMYCVGPQVSAT